MLHPEHDHDSLVSGATIILSECLYNAPRRLYSLYFTTIRFSIPSQLTLQKLLSSLNMSNKNQSSENMIWDFRDFSLQGPEERFSPRYSDIELASKLVPSVMLKNPEALSSDLLSMIADAYPDLPSTHGLQSEYERWWVKWHEDKDIGGTISNFVDSLHWADNDLYPNVRMILFISAIRPSTITSNERSFLTLKRLKKTYLR